MDKTPTPHNFTSYIFRKMGFNLSDQTEDVDCEDCKPSERVIRNIMNYSRALSVVKSKKAGMFNLLLN